MTGVQKGIKIGAIILAIFIICVIINAIIAVVYSLTNKNGDNSFIESYINIRNIEIDLETSNLEIRSGNEFRVEASNVSDSFKVRENRGNLEIEEDGFWLFGSSNGEVIVYIPNEINELNIDTGAGEIKISDITASYFNLDQGTGIIEINNSLFDSAEIDGGTGSIDVNASVFSNMDLDTGVGEVNFNGEILGRSNIDVGVGEVNLDLAGGESLYTLRIDRGIGSVKINSEDYDSSSYGSGSNYINVSGGIGSININFF